MHPTPLWTEETFHFSGGDYLRRLIELTRAARFSIRIESYIFELDPRSRELVEVLGAAAERGVKVRVIIDAIGSYHWGHEDFSALFARGVRVRAFGRPRDLLRDSFRLAIRGHFFRAYQTLRKFQLRDHRKLAVFDSEVALVGSANIGETFERWRETTVELRGPGVAALRQSFVKSWRFANRESIPARDRTLFTPEVRDNFTSAERRFANRHFLERIRGTERRLWMTTAYFNPRPKLLLALFQILDRRMDLKIIVPMHSDISWFPWLSRAAFAGLISRGARVFEYKGPMLHAKSTLFDGRAFVGSRNMNYRSFMHDLELDVELESKAAVASLEAQFAEDLANSVELTSDRLRGYRPIAFLVSIGAIPFRRWL